MSLVTEILLMGLVGQPASGDARLREHFDGALQMLAHGDVSGLSSGQRARRAVVTERLRTYVARGRFPKNRDFDARTPYFIDEGGTRCAVAYLMEVTDRGALAAKIAAERNNALVDEFAIDAEVQAWLDEHGITVEEAARIQPAYDFLEEDFTASSAICFGRSPGAVYVQRGEIVDLRGDIGGLTIGRRFGGLQTAVLSIEDDTGRSSRSYPIDGEGRYIHVTRDGTTLSAHRTVLMEAVVASVEECSRILEESDPRWTEPLGDGGCGCGNTSTSRADPTSAAWLVLVAALALLRRRPTGANTP